MNAGTTTALEQHFKSVNCFSAERSKLLGIVLVRFVFGFKARAETLQLPWVYYLSKEIASKEIAW